MGWAADRISAFSAATGPRRYVIAGLAGTIAGVFGTAQSWLTGHGIDWLVGVRSSLVAIVVVLGLIAYWLLDHLAQLRQRIAGSRLELALLRKRGVELRNFGQSIADEAALAQWENDIREWSKSVITNIRNINEADAEWFAILDIIPDPRVGLAQTPVTVASSNLHKKLFREHDFRVKRLGKMIYRIWER